MIPPEHGKSPRPNSIADKRYSHLVKGSKVEATSKAEGFIGSWFEATVIKPPEMPNSKFRSKRMTLVEYSSLLNEDASLLLREQVDAAMLRPVPPRTEEDGGFVVGDVVDTFEKDGWWTGKVDRVVKDEGGEEARYVVSFAVPNHQIEFGKDSMRFHLDWINGKWFRFWNSKRQELAVKEDGLVTLAISGYRNDPKELVILNPAPTGCDPKCCPGVLTSVNEQSTPLDGKRSPPLPSSPHHDRMDLELPAKKLKRTCAEEPSVHANSKPEELSGPLRERDHQNKEPGYHVTSSLYGKDDTGVRAKRTKRRAGPYKGIPNSSLNGEVSKADDVQKDLSLEEQLAEAVGFELALVRQAKSELSNAISDSTGIGKAFFTGNFFHFSCITGEAPEADAINNPPMQELTLVAFGTELNPKEQGHSDLVNDERRSPVSEGTIVVLNERQQSPSNDVSVMRPSLPFLKTVPVWEAVESLEIFRKFPQQPHFLPLIDARERFREGLAIAKMVTFASTAENAINLSIDDDVDSFTDCLETLRALESHGFNAKTVQSRLMKLISLKKLQLKIDEEKKELKGQVSGLKHEIAEVKGEICEMVNKIKFYQDKLKSALLKEEEKDLQIFTLETSLDVLNTVISRAPLDFEDFERHLESALVPVTDSL